MNCTRRVRTAALHGRTLDDGCQSTTATQFGVTRDLLPEETGRSELAENGECTWRRSRVEVLREGKPRSSLKRRLVGAVCTRSPKEDNDIVSTSAGDQPTSGPALGFQGVAEATLIRGFKHAKRR